MTRQDILEFEQKYKGSAEEREDLIGLYVQHEGDLDAIMASLLCSSQEDEPRVCGIIQEAIDAEEVQAFPAFTKESKKKKTARRKRVRNPLQSLKQLTQRLVASAKLKLVVFTFQADRERQEAEEMQKEMGLGDQEESLVMMLQVTKSMYETSVYVFVSSLNNHHISFLFFTPQQRQKSREQNYDSFLSDLEAKYSKKTVKSKRGKKK